MEVDQLYDAEGLGDEMKSLMKTLKLLADDTKQASINVCKGEEALKTAKTELDSVLKQKKLYSKNGTLEPIREKEETIKLEDLDAQALVAQAEQVVEAKNPLDPVVNKFAELGYDPEGAFDMLDDNGDAVLTIKEIQDGMKFHKITLTDEEWVAFLGAIDQNSDGVLDLEEWEAILAPKVKQQTDLYAIMGGVNIADPLVLEERILDLQYRNRHLDKELRFLRAQSDASHAQKKKIKDISKKILVLEAEDEETKERQKLAEVNIESDL